MLPNEKIQDEQEFNSVCASSGKEAARLLDYIAESLKADAWLPSTSDGDVIRNKKKLANIEEFKSRIMNAAIKNSESEY